MSNMVELVKLAAVQAVDAEKPVSFMFGTVISDEPLEIRLSQKLILSQANLLLTRNVTDYDVEMQLSHVTEDAGGHSHLFIGSGSVEPVGDHTHEYKGVKNFTVLNGLKTGENVLLARVQGGKKYVVIDRMEG